MTENSIKESVKNFLDEEGRVKVWPSKVKNKLAVLEYIATQFEYNRDYKEKKVNEILDKWHTFSDYFILRRSLVAYKLLARERDGSRYWKIGKKAIDLSNPGDFCALPFD